MATVGEDGTIRLWRAGAAHEVRVLPLLGPCKVAALATDGLVRECLAGRAGTFESGELAVVEASAGRLLPTSLFTRWTSEP